MESDLRDIDEQDEPIKGCLQFLREHILRQNEHITET